MADALGDLGLDHLSWVVEDDLDEGEVAEAALEVRKAISKRTAEGGSSAIAVRWLANLLERVEAHGAGLSGRFGERIDLRDRY